MNLQTSIFIIVNYIMFIILLIGVGEFIHYSNGFNEIGIFTKSQLYLIKWCVFLVYPLLLLKFFIQNLSRIDLFLITISALIVYSFLFVKSVVDGFENFIFQFLNIIVILIFYNLLSIGYTFGMFYLENNHIYNYFTEVETNILNESLSKDVTFGYQMVLFIAIKGIEPFFNFPEIVINQDVVHSYLYFIPLFEHLLGNVYFLLIIGFFVSYSVSLLMDKNK